MGLFDKRRKSSDDFDSPVEEINLSAPSAPVPAASSADERRERAAPPPPEPTVDYGIDQAIALMRHLPGDNVELVVQVVKHTLESTHIKIATIINDGSRKQRDIEGRIAVLRREIGELENEIATRKTEIAALEADYKETSSVKERLILAEKLTGESGAAPEPAAAAAPSGPTPRASSVPPAAGGPAAAPAGLGAPRTPSVIVKK